LPLRYRALKAEYIAIVRLAAEAQRAQIVDAGAHLEEGLSEGEESIEA
jgi:hypothetical protein